MDVGCLAAHLASTSTGFEAIKLQMDIDFSAFTEDQQYKLMADLILLRSAARALQPVWQAG
ncbi:MAG: hypothetical protein EOO28_05525 [Comamonadaceae bacterium]|nr:MAG: hypothetical protein EOO28_05525 [Comamonadaceae bacterium]